MLRSLVQREEKPVLLQRPAILTSAFIWTIMVFVVGTITWAAVAKIDQSVPAQGKLEPMDSTNEVKAPTGGVVRELLVKNGDLVEKGQLLITFDPTGPEADVGSLRANRQELARQLDLLRSEAAGTNVGTATNARIADLLRNREVRVAEIQYYRVLLRGDGGAIAPSQRSRLADTRAAQTARMGRLRSEINELQRQLADIRVQRQSLRTRVAQSQERLSINEGIVDDLTPLVEEGAIPRLQYKNQQQQVLNNQESVTALQGQIASLTEQEGRIQAAIATKNQEISQADSEWSADIQNRLAANEREVADIDAQLARTELDNRRQMAGVQGQIAQTDGQIVRAEQSVRYQEVRAPVAGRIFDIKASGTGYVANPSEPLMSIVPEGELVASVYVTNKDIGFVSVGMPVEVQIDSFPALEFGNIKGRLVSIGSDVLPPDQEVPVYRFPLKIELDSQQLMTQNGVKLDIQSGMSVSARIKTRKRSVIDIFLGQFKSRADSFETVR